MRGVIFQTIDAGLQHTQIFLRMICGEKTHFTCCGAVVIGHDIRIVTRLEHEQKISFILLVEDERILRGVSAKFMPI